MRSELAVLLCALGGCTTPQPSAPEPPTTFTTESSFSDGPPPGLDAGPIYLEFGPSPARIVTLTVNVPLGVVQRLDQYGPLGIDRRDAGECVGIPRRDVLSQTLDVPPNTTVRYEISEFSRGPDGGMYLAYHEGSLDTARLKPGCNRLAIVDGPTGLTMVTP